MTTHQNKLLANYDQCLLNTVESSTIVKYIIKLESLNTFFKHLHKNTQSFYSNMKNITTKITKIYKTKKTSQHKAKTFIFSNL